MDNRRVSLFAGPLVILAGTAGVGATLAAPPNALQSLAPVRSLEPVVLTGSQFPFWSAGPEVTFRAPEPPSGEGSQTIPLPNTQPAPGPFRSDCYQDSPSPDVNGWTDPNHGDHSCYQSNQLPFRTLPGRSGVDPQSLLGYAWNEHAGRFVQIPFQVDTKWTHYISNNASGFASYSGIDQELTYTFDREGWRFWSNAPFSAADPSVVCQATPTDGRVTTPDPNPGLIDTDELVFMARDAGPEAPATAPLPNGIAEATQVAVTDPVTEAQSFVYVMRSSKNSDGTNRVAPEYTTANSPYVRYQRDANADQYAYSQSSYGSYGNARYGPVCDPATGLPAQGFTRDASGNVTGLDPSHFVQRRPLDYATVTTPRYRFHYDGRWVMDSLRVSPDDSGLDDTPVFGPSVVDRWKARAFQQSPGGKTPCCGYEEEATNWGGSSVLMGERVGPVRAIRVTWGADSSTNNIRTEIFYPYEIRYQDHLRVHVIPPLDGIYVMRDMAAGQITTYYNPFKPAGVRVDGINDQMLGNMHAHVGPDGVSYDSSDQLGDMIRTLNGGRPVTAGNPDDQTCTSDACIHGDFAISDPTFSGPGPGILNWEELTGPAGTLVEHWNVQQVTAGGLAQSMVAEPYYRDDSCFDDGTGNDPGPKLHLRSAREPLYWWYDPISGVPTSSTTWDQNGNPIYPSGVNLIPRRCWNHNADGSPYSLSQPQDPPPDPAFSPLGDVRYFQGDIGTHGLHLMFVAESDNAAMTVPIDEIDSEQRQVVLPPDEPNVGEQYGHSFDRPLITTVTPRTLVP